MSDPTQLTGRADFQATGDPGVLESADRGVATLLTYSELYSLWERQQWSVGALDFSVDREHWWQIDEDERFERVYAMKAFFVGEQRVTDELGPMMRAAPSEDMRIFLATQIADEARHVRFFDRFYAEVGVLESKTLQDRLAEASRDLSDEFRELFDGMLKRRVDKLARDPGDLETLVEAVTLYHMVIEGMLAITGQHYVISYNEQQGTLPAFVEGFQNVARDEHRHVAFGARFLREMARQDPRHAEAISRVLAEAAPIVNGVLRPPWLEDGDGAVLGYTLEETYEFAAKALERRLKVIGLAPVAG